MKTQIEWLGKIYVADLAKPLSIAIPLKNGIENPNCYFAEPVKFEIIEAEGFIGSIKLGGTVNHQKITVSPHGNGTHTECYGHISANNIVIAEQLQLYHHVAQLVSVTPIAQNDDFVINETIIENIALLEGARALVIRTVPNRDNKLRYNYSGSNPVYFTEGAMKLIVDHGIEHLVTDLPSVDKEQDEGKLLAHKMYWRIDEEIRSNATITELAFVPDNIKDGLYLLNLQVLAIHLDASPSNPILYSLNPIIE